MKETDLLRLSRPIVSLIALGCLLSANAFSSTLQTNNESVHESTASVQAVSPRDVNLWEAFLQKDNVAREETVRQIVTSRVIAGCKTQFSSGTLAEDETAKLLARLSTAAQFLQSTAYASIAKPTDDEITSYIHSNPNRFQRQPSADLQQIFIPAEEGATPAEVKQAEEKATLAKKRVDAGEAFSVVAAQMSEGSVSSLRGGSVGTIYPNSINPALSKIIFSMSEGEVRGPVRSKRGFHVFKVVSISNETSYSESQKREMAVEDLLQEKQFRKSDELIDEATSLAQPVMAAPPGTDKFDDASTNWLATSSGKSYSARLATLGVKAATGQEEINPQDWSLETSGFKNQVLLAELCEARGLTKHPDFVRLTELAEQQRLAQVYWKKLRMELTPKPGELERFFEDNRDQFKLSPLLSGKILSVPVLTSTQTLKLSALQRHEKLAPVARQLARMVGACTTGSLEQILPAVRRVCPDAQIQDFKDAESIGHALDTEALRMNVGGVSKPIETNRAVVVLQLDGRRSQQMDFNRFHALILEAWKTHVFKAKREEVEKFILQNGCVPLN